MSTDPYTLLGIGPGASAAEIKRAYRALAREHHPDRNPGDPASEGRFKAIAAAYELLTDPARPYAAPRAGNEAPETFFADFTDSLERAERLVFQELLPRYVATRAGRAERIVRMARDFATSAIPLRLQSPKPPIWARWAARREVRGLGVYVDYRRAAQPVQVWRRTGGGWVLVLYPAAFWEAGVREPVPLDDAVLTVLTGQVLGILRTQVRVELRGIEEEGWETLVEAAREQDRADTQRIWGSRAMWAAVALLSAFLLYMGWSSKSR